MRLGRSSTLVLAWSSAALLALLLASTPALADERELPFDVTLAGDARIPDAPEEYLTSDDSGFKVVYHPAARERVRTLLPELATIRDELRAALGVEVLSHVEIRVSALPLELERLAPSGVEGSFGAGGAAFADKHLIVVAAHAGTADALEPAVRHLLAHVAFEEATNGAAVPPWFQEGFAVHFARGDLAERAQVMEVSTLGGDELSLSRVAHTKLDRRGSAFAADFVRFASRGDSVVPSLVDGLRSGLPFDRALETAFGAESSSIDAAWREDIARRYAFLPTIVLGVVLFAIVFLVGLIRRRRRAALAGERQMPLPKKRRIRARVLQGDTSSNTPIPDPGAMFSDSLGKPAEIPKIEHDGRWHTLH
ncbi:MAG TPA: hypothetical protein VL400_09695 [Polyangiaceae bacterium]|jgi:hypothetical protein|nr:hypothetical protein [Polyangiaceae bacterium]